jgi:L-gulonate 5-dehydrogenase
LVVTVRAVLVKKPHEVAVVDRHVEAPGRGEVVVRFLQGGLCGSDLAAYQGVSPMVVYPRIIGHEMVGEVVQSGSGADRWLGARVVIEPLLPCGTCVACRKGRYNTCVHLQVMGVHTDGGFQDHFVVPAVNLHRLPEDMDLDTAVLAEPLTVACQAVFRSGVMAGDKVIIFGAGPIGLLALQVVTSYLGAAALVVDVLSQRLKLAEKLGAAATVDVSGWTGPGTSPALIHAVKDWTEGDMAAVAIEATGHPASTTAAIDCLGHAGRLSLVGWNKAPITVDTVQLMRKELDVYGSRNSCHMFPRAISILAGGGIDTQTMISHRFPMSKAVEAMDLMSNKQSTALKVILFAEGGSLGEKR